MFALPYPPRRFLLASSRSLSESLYHFPLGLLP
uniref:Uncharacterized protein n=1 Tax=virus sp. ctML55 TaxID=2827627 RepID=A0A8S5RIV8_9VIRU|nr:MAG TPA: hypothetical protein [virus sp. ctML55]